MEVKGHHAHSTLSTLDSPTHQAVIPVLSPPWPSGQSSPRPLAPACDTGRAHARCTRLIGATDQSPSDEPAGRADGRGAGQNVRAGLHWTCLNFCRKSGSVRIMREITGDFQCAEYCSPFRSLPRKHHGAASPDHVWHFCSGVAGNHQCKIVFKKINLSCTLCEDIRFHLEERRGGEKNDVWHRGLVEYLNPAHVADDFSVKGAAGNAISVWLNLLGGLQ